MTKSNAIRIGNSIGKVLEVEYNAALGVCCTKFLRVKVNIDAHKPLQPGFLLPRSGQDPVWIQYRYERLSDFCYRCGLLGHVMANCNQRLDRPEGANRLGPLMKADSVDVRRFYASSREEGSIPIVEKAIGRAFIGLWDI